VSTGGGDGIPTSHVHSNQIVQYITVTVQEERTNCMQLFS
jgi:hypothetical protein